MQNNNFSSGLIISEEVIATIAANAAKDVDGVAGLGVKPADLYTAFKIGSDDLKHVGVTVSDFDIKVHMYIELTNNVKIKDVCSNVQNAVKTAIQNMTGKVVTRVDVTVTGVATKSAEASEPDYPAEP